MNIFERLNLPKVSNIRSIAGIVLVLTGAVLFLDRYLETGWLSYVVLPLSGILIFSLGLRHRNPLMLLSGSVIAGIGIGIASMYSPVFSQNEYPLRIGLFSFYFGLGWLVGMVSTSVLTNKSVWWSGIPAGLLLGLSICFMFDMMRLVDFVFILSLALGFSFLLWGLIEKLIGLVIPGCILASVGPAIFFAWSSTTNNSLVSTGIMLVWLALGWVLITLSGRILVHRFIWWPLIPGGILAMVGWGLYIGGDPDNALGFISNTGSIGLMIFGLYLLLMRKGIHH